MTVEHKTYASIYKLSEDAGITFSQILKELFQDGYKAQLLQIRQVRSFKIKLYYRREPSSGKWKEFLRPIAKSDQPILKDKFHNWGYVLFFYNDTSTYVITGGVGHFAIQEYVDDDFGFDVLSRLLSKYEKAIIAKRAKNLIGKTLGATQFFRGTQALFEENDFGQICQELITKLDHNMLETNFGISKDTGEEKRVICYAKTSFKINRPITLEQLGAIIENCSRVLSESDPYTALTQAKQLHRKRDEELINVLKEQLYGQLWQRYTDLETSKIDFDLCHREFDSYLSASSYRLKIAAKKWEILNEISFPQLTDVDILFKAIKYNCPSSIAGIKDFVSLMEHLKIESYSQDDVRLTKGSLISHLWGDIPNEDKKYFFLENKWYALSSEFIASLHTECNSYTKIDYTDDILTKLWLSDMDEDAYNAQYLGEDDTIVIHPTTIEGIEPCDILRWDEQHLYFCYVKKGFDNRMRDLTNQVLLAAKRISNDLASSGEYIDAIYKKLSDRSDSAQLEGISREQFKALFKKNLIFVLCFLDESIEKPSRHIQTNIDDFGSTIAKCSFVDLAKNIRNQGLTFKITQLKSFILQVPQDQSVAA